MLLILLLPIIGEAIDTKFQYTLLIFRLILGNYVYQIKAFGISGPFPGLILFFSTDYGSPSVACLHTTPNLFKEIRTMTSPWYTFLYSNDSLTQACSLDGNAEVICVEH